MCNSIGRKRLILGTAPQLFAFRTAPHGRFFSGGRRCLAGCAERLPIPFEFKELNISLESGLRPADNTPGPHGRCCPVSAGLPVSARDTPCATAIDQYDALPRQQERVSRMRSRLRYRTAAPTSRHHRAPRRSGNIQRSHEFAERHHAFCVFARQWFTTAPEPGWMSPELLPVHRP